MIRLLFVGDGPSDAAVNPRLVENMLGVPIAATPDSWARLHDSRRGYDRRLLFAVRRARDLGLQGVVATIDKDKSPGRERLRALEAGRVRDRETAAPLPAALGCADPHAEAWLLDDPVAVSRVFQVAANAVPNVRKVRSPKDEIAHLHAGSSRAEETLRAILVEIAQALDPRHCQHKRETGFAAFEKEVRQEIGPLAG